jgi:ribonuclease HI
MSKTKKQYYIVIHGRKPGLYTEWFGDNGASKQVDGLTDAIYKGFYTKEDALHWLREFSQETLQKYAPNLLDLVDYSVPLKIIDEDIELLKGGKVIMHTDGSTLGNPGVGGYATILKFKDKEKEISGGFQNTTNNRMELMACIEGFRALKQKCSVIVYSDSKYLVDSMTNGWAVKWRNNNWIKKDKHKVLNSDLWGILLELVEQHDVEFKWIRSHNIDKSNHRCDLLAKEASKKLDLEIDNGFNSEELQSSMFST